MCVVKKHIKYRLSLRFWFVLVQIPRDGQIIVMIVKAVKRHSNKSSSSNRDSSKVVKIVAVVNYHDNQGDHFSLYPRIYFFCISG